MPDAAGVSTLDGRTLRDESGAPVTVPLGEVGRGSVPPSKADAQVDRAMLLQARDACARGVRYPITGTASGEIPLEEAVEQARLDMERNLAANGGDPYRDACDVVAEMDAAQNGGPATD